MRTTRLFVLVLALPCLALAETIPTGASEGAELVINVDRASQTIEARTSQAILNDVVSTGRITNSTSPGCYRPEMMYPRYTTYREYSSKTLDYAVFFKAGLPIYAYRGQAPLGIPASHGAVRVRPQTAKLIFDLVKKAGLDKTIICIR